MMPMLKVTESEVRRAKENAVGGKADRCVKGKSCSAACIAPNKLCLVDIPSVVSNSLRRVSNLVSRLKERVAPSTFESFEVAQLNRLAKRLKSISINNGSTLNLVDRDDRKRLDSIKRALKDEPNNPEIKRYYQAFRDQLKEKLLRNVKFVEDLSRNLPEGAKITQRDGILTVRLTTRFGDIVRSMYSPSIGFHFSVNDSNDIGTVKGGRAAELSVAKAAGALFNATMATLPPGTPVKTSAHTADGGGAKRTSIYVKKGFSEPEKIGGPMYGITGPDGKLRPATWEDYVKAMDDPNTMKFSETMESEASSPRATMGYQDEEITEDLADWYQLVFGRELN